MPADREKSLPRTSKFYYFRHYKQGNRFVSSNSKEQPDFCTLGLARSRWNVLDLIKMVGRESIPAYLFYDIDMTWAENLRKKFAALGYKTTVTAILLKAIAIAQRAHPIT